ncbi:hypothetical protein CRG98_042833, partial [Punica granatum]
MTLRAMQQQFERMNMVFGEFRERLDRQDERLERFNLRPCHALGDPTDNHPLILLMKKHMMKKRKWPPMPLGGEVKEEEADQGISFVGSTGGETPWTITQ